MNERAGPTPDELDAMSDEEFFRLARETGYDKTWGLDNRFNHELSARLIVALRSFKEASDRSSRTLTRLTWVLIGLTVVLVVLTGVLVWYTIGAD